ncbi:putative short chain dehydrogenase [Escherichia coli]|uniref:Putative short chain dehydrogenase n=1 Tax=Escherichia coli TaxID=562 RepID=A0A376RID5_ECOLX|nr:putative short chain dehydrogenase [Escherichia coli]
MWWRRGSDKHVAYAASKAALDNMTRSFARKLAPEVKVNSIAPSLILFNEHDDAEYRQQALNKSLMKTAPGEKEVIRPGRLLTYQLLCHRTQFPT